MESGVDKCVDPLVDLATVCDRSSPLGTFLEDCAEWAPKELKRKILSTERANKGSKCQLFIDIVPDVLGELHSGTVIPPCILGMWRDFKGYIPTVPDRSDELLGVEIVSESFLPNISLKGRIKEGNSGPVHVGELGLSTMEDLLDEGLLEGRTGTLGQTVTRTWGWSVGLVVCFQDVIPSALLVCKFVKVVIGEVLIINRRRSCLRLWNRLWNRLGRGLRSLLRKHDR